MHVLFIILLLLALIMLLADAFGFRVNKVNLVSLGLACWVAVPLIQILTKQS